MELPHDLEIEQVFLGTCLFHNDLLDHVVDYLEPDHFANALHQDIFRVMVDKFRANENFTPLSIKAKFERHSELPDMSSGQYLSKLAAISIPPKVATGYGRAIHDYYLRRKVIEKSHLSSQEAYDLKHGTGFDIIQELQHNLSELSITVNDDQKLSHISKGAKEAWEMVKAGQNREISGVSTGIKTLDEALGGLGATQLIIVAGRPGMGKSALALIMGKGAAQDGTTTAFFSIEMKAGDLTMRLASDLMSNTAFPISYSDALKGKLNASQMNTVKSGLKRTSDLDIYISDRGGQTVDSVRTETRKLERKHGKKIGLIIIDYLQLMRVNGYSSYNRNNELSQITRGLKTLAVELDIPIVVLSQLSRQLEQRENKRPILSDLRDSGAIEQDADAVLFVYRDHYYLKQNEPKSISDQVDWQDELKRKERLMEVIIGKQRRGPTTTLRLESFLETNTIRDFT